MLIFSGLTFVVEKDANPGTINIVVYISLRIYLLKSCLVLFFVIQCSAVASFLHSLGDSQNDGCSLQTIQIIFWRGFIFLAGPNLLGVGKKGMYRSLELHKFSMKKSPENLGIFGLAFYIILVCVQTNKGLL